MDPIKAVKDVLASTFEINVGQVLFLILILTSFLLSPWNIMNSTNSGFHKNEGLGVYELVRKVKVELAKADSARVFNNEAPLFRLKDFEMEINFVVTQTRQQGGKTEFKLVTIEGSHATENSQAQKLKLRWEAIPEKNDTLYKEGDTMKTKQSLINPCHGTYP